MFESSQPFHNTMTTVVNTTLTTITPGNQTTNGTALPPGNNRLNPYAVIFVEVICILVFFLGIVGNSLVLIVFGYRWKKLKLFEIFMMNLAFADLIGTIVIPLKMLLELMELSFISIGHTGCKIISFLPMTTITVSSLTLLIISLDRYIIVRWPLRKPIEGWQIALTLFLTWTFAAGLSFIYLLGDRIMLYDNPKDHLPDIHFCRNFMPLHENATHIVVAFFIQLVIPLLAMSVLYSLIAVELRRVATCHLFSQNEREVGIRLKRNRKATFLFVTIVAAFYIFVLPSNIFFLMYILKAIPHDNMPKLFLIYTLLQMILMFNSCVNPVIYSNLHTSFRRSTLKLFCSCIFKRFKNYDWEGMGGSLRSVMRKSSRSVRSSFQSSRDLMSSMRRKSTESIYKRRQSAESLFKRRQSTDSVNNNIALTIRDRSLPNSTQPSPSQFSGKFRASPEFERCMIRNLQNQKKHNRLKSDDCFSSSDDVFEEVRSPMIQKDFPSPKYMTREKKRKVLNSLHEQTTLEEVL
uniref:GPCR15 n=1 Tax=Clytia hemisphaerica TaxID=252671 RepID=A0A4V0NPZ2_9CNID|nr:GPCR15 [Clytia hemisphaerica]